MEQAKRVMIVLFFTILLILFLSGIQIITGDTIFITKKGLVQENKISELKISPKIIKIEKLGDFIIKDNINIELTPGSSGAYKKVEFFRKGSSEGFEEFNLKNSKKCTSSKCISKDGSPVINSKVIDAVKWKTGTYIARVKDGKTNKYITTEFKIENNI